jgi:hypothetical protein
MYARRFLWVIAILTFLVVAAAITYRLAGDTLMRWALVPSVEFKAPPASETPDYTKLASWAAHPGLPKDAARWAPEGYAAAPRPGAALFFVTPTALTDRSRWNARPTDEPERIDAYLRQQASIFNSVASVWAPRYRQATYGAFLTTKPEAQKALDLAYGDVLAAFEAFLAAQPKDMPIILAGHSQGALHLLRLLKERVAGTPLASRIVAVYIPGWPLSVTADLPALGFPACHIADETGCILTWQSFAEPAEYKAIRDVFDAGTGLTGAKRLGTEMLCVNPIEGVVTTTPAQPNANFGALVPEKGGGTLRPKAIGAACTATGILNIGPPPAGYGEYVLPGNNYHVFDFPLFWANLRADAERRTDRFRQPVLEPKAPKLKTAAA